MGLEVTQLNGLLKEQLNDTVSEGLLFNVDDQNLNAQTSEFVIPGKTKINKGKNAIGNCGDIPAECGDVSTFKITADMAWSLNKKFPRCLSNQVPDLAMTELGNASIDFRKEVLTYDYSKVLPNMTDITSEIKDAVNIKEAILKGVQKAAKLTGKAPNQLIAVVNSDAYFDLANIDIQCCDIDMQNQETGSMYAKKLKLGGLYYIDDDNILSGNFVEEGDVPELTDDKIVKFAIYDKDYAIAKKFCEVDPYLKEYTPENQSAKISQIIGDGYIGAGAAKKVIGVKAFLSVASELESIPIL